MLRSLCVGDAGTLGREVAKLTTYHVGHTDFDITCRPSIVRVLDKYHPDVVINCAGIVKERIVPEACFVLVNALGPWYLRYECERVGAKLLHVSTDCVFSGKLKFPITYAENNVPSPVDVYGKSKLLGEAGHTTVRSSLIGHGQRGLIHWLCTTPLATVEGYRNAMWSGLTTPVLAAALYEIAQHMKDYPPLIHVHGEYVSKYALLGMLNKRFQLGKVIHPVDKPIVNRCLSSNYQSPIAVPLVPDMIEALPDA